jgi:hypothetical protein
MRNLEMRLRLDGSEWRVYPLARPGRWLACCTRELGWSEARRLIGQVAALDDAAFQSWHAQVLAAGSPSTEGHAALRSRAPGHTRTGEGGAKG